MDLRRTVGEKLDVSISILWSSSGEWCTDRNVEFLTNGSSQIHQLLHGAATNLYFWITYWWSCGPLPKSLQLVKQKWATQYWKLPDFELIWLNRATCMSKYSYQSGGFPFEFIIGDVTFAHMLAFTAHKWYNVFMFLWARFHHRARTIYFSVYHGHCTCSTCSEHSTVLPLTWTVRYKLWCIWLPIIQMFL